jgi:hypothetical protein
VDGLAAYAPDGHVVHTEPGILHLATPTTRG